jgi:beta-glucosidase-like glycosyl hydrolase
MNLARLLFPDLRAGPDGGFEHQEDRIRLCLRLGVGGFILFGGRAEKVRELTERLRAESRHPVLIGADLERGAGQQFRGLTQLPPLAALGWLDDLVAIHEAGRFTAAEARSVGVDWVYAPVADLAVEPNNPIVGTRAFGAHPVAVARQVAAWVIGCEAGGALSCAKHFPGHGRTTTDSHLVLPTVGAKVRRLADDLVPFAAAVEAGVPTVMSAHVAYPALDRSGAPATLSRKILTKLLRGRLGFEGLVVSDAMNMGGVVEAAGAGGAASIAALAAGVDALLHPDDPEGLASELTHAGPALSPARAADALDRVMHATQRAAALPPGDAGGAAEWARDLARRVTFPMRGGSQALAGERVRLRTVDDDLGGPYAPPSRDVFPAALRRAGVELVDGDGEGNGSASGARTVLAVYCEPRAWKGRPGLSMDSQRSVRQALNADPDALVVLFAHPRLAEGLPEGVAALEAWGGEAVMQEAAAARLGSGASD